MIPKSENEERMKANITVSSALHSSWKVLTNYMSIDLWSR